jgi:D-glycero-D-manno-heptose 1,7-bisphosphate phosphatase
MQPYERQYREGKMQETRLIILDRDGVINQDSDSYVKSVEEYVLLPNSVSAIVRLKQAGWTVAVATNQSGLAKGLYQRTALHLMHEKLQSALREHNTQVDWIMYSPHQHASPCRKPSAGLYQAIAWRFGLSSLVGVPVVGDSWRDSEAALSVGAYPIQVKTGKGSRTLAQHGEDLARHQIPIVEDLLGAVVHLESRS